MPTLAEAQSSFSQALMDPALEAPSDIRRPANATHYKRFDVYRNNVTVTAIDALADTFPAVRKLVGDDFFQGAARFYFSRSPMQTPLLFQYGETFGDFLEAFGPAQKVPYLGDVARLEFARVQAYHAADAAPLDITALGAIPENQVASAYLKPHPSASLVRSRYPVVSLWGASTGLLNSGDVDMTKAEDALTVRPNLDVETTVLPRAGGPFLGALMEGQSLGDATEMGTAADPNFDLATHLTGLFNAGTFRDVSTQEPAPERT